MKELKVTKWLVTKHMGKSKINFLRGNIYLADLGDKYEAVGSEQFGIRPVVVVQNALGNKYSPNIIVAPITPHRIGKKPLSTHVFLEKELLENIPNSVDSKILLEQVRTISKERVLYPMNVKLPLEKLKEMDFALKISLGIS